MPANGPTPGVLGSGVRNGASGSISSVGNVNLTEYDAQEDQDYSEMEAMVATREDLMMLKKIKITHKWKQWLPLLKIFKIVVGSQIQEPQTMLLMILATSILVLSIMIDFKNLFKLFHIQRLVFLAFL